MGTTIIRLIRITCGTLVFCPYNTALDRLQEARRTLSSRNAMPRRGRRGSPGPRGARWDDLRYPIRMSKPRPRDQIRLTTIEPYPSAAPGSVMITQGQTRVLCTASIANELPKWLQGADGQPPGRGWVIISG